MNNATLDNDNKLSIIENHITFIRSVDKEMKELLCSTFLIKKVIPPVLIY